MYLPYPTVVRLTIEKKMGLASLSLHVLTKQVKVRFIFLQLQRNWNSRSCTSMNRVGKTPVNTSTSVNMAATISRQARTGANTPPPTHDTPNTSTLPIRNFYKYTNVNSNLPKSASTWGPLNKSLHCKVT